MSDPILTPRLQLIPLDQNQLNLVLQDLEAFEKSLNILVMRSWITERVRHAVAMKIEKMQKAAPDRARLAHVLVDRDQE